VLPLLWLVPAFPLAGFLILAGLGNRRLPHAVTTIVGVGSVGLSALVTLVIGAEFLAAPPVNSEFVQSLWTWITIGKLNLAVAFRLD
jgi:NADH-quinone oxidoreductase subunit L